MYCFVELVLTKSYLQTDGRTDTVITIYPPPQKKTPKGLHDMFISVHCFIRISIKLFQVTRTVLLLHFNFT